jgi:hypothetical protein
LWIVRAQGHKHADPPYTLALPRLSRDRPRRSRRAAEQGDELAALHVWMAPA